MATTFKKIANLVEDVTDERSKGFAAANPDLIEYVPEYRALVKKKINRDKVFILGCGGSGCEPLYPGMIGYGGIDATSDGQVFTAPSAYSTYRLLHDHCNEHGAVLLYGNFDGDFMNGDMAIEMMALEGKEVLNIMVMDDISSSLHDKEKRGGIAGLCVAIKMLGAASELGYTIDDFRKLKVKIENNFFTMPVTLEVGAVPGTGISMGDVPPGEVEFGKGFNGERGIRSEKLMRADEMSDIVMKYIIDDMELKKGEDICVLVNGLGATSWMELQIVMNRISEKMNEMGVSIYGAKVGSYFAVQETKGFSITFVRVDSELKRLYDFPIYTPHFSILKPEDVELLANTRYKGEYH